MSKKLHQGHMRKRPCHESDTAPLIPIRVDAHRGLFLFYEKVTGWAPIESGSNIKRTWSWSHHVAFWGGQALRTGMSEAPKSAGRLWGDSPPMRRIKRRGKYIGSGRRTFSRAQPLNGRRCRSRYVVPCACKLDERALPSRHRGGCKCRS